MSKISDELKAEAIKPRRVFLVAAAIVSALVAAAYVYQDDVMRASGPLAYGALLIVLVLLALSFVACYRTPRLGNRLLGYDIVITDPDKKGVKSDVQYGGGFKTDSAADAKRMNSRRKQTRSTRRKLAQVTREMQQEKDNAGKTGGEAE